MYIWSLSIFIITLSLALLISYYFLPAMYTKIRIKTILRKKKIKTKVPKKDKKTKKNLSTKQKLYQQLNVILEESTLPINANDLLTLIFWSNVLAFMVGTMIFGILVGTFIAILVTPVYLMFFLQLRKRRKKKMLQQLPGVLELIVNALKTGYSIIQTIELISNDNFQPLSDEFKKVYDSVRFGSSLERALTDFAERVEIEEITVLSDTIIISRETGGNLTNVVDKLLETMREKLRIENEIKALTSQGRISAIIVGSMPVAIFSILMLINQEYMSVLFTHSIGYLLIGLSILSQIIGIIIMNKIISLKVR